MMKLVWCSRPFTDYTSAMMKYEARYEGFVNKWYEEPEDGNFEDATGRFSKLYLVTPTSAMTKNGTCSGYSRASS